jgi:hypothetical protein
LAPSARRNIVSYLAGLDAKGEGMTRPWVRPLLVTAAAVALLAAAGSAGARSGSSHAIAGVQQVCLSHVAHTSNYYTPNCTGHDEPELDPVSSAPHSALDVTWHVQLPADGTTTVTSVGPTFWFGGTVADSNPDKLGGQGFLELQFYADSRVTTCSDGGGFFVNREAGTYTACSPVWTVTQEGDTIEEPAAFNGMLSSTSGGPFVMHAGDIVDVHIWAPSMHDAYREQVTDETTHQTSAVLVLISTTDGPLRPAFDTNEIGHALDWGIVWDTPMAFVWEIGHTDIYGPLEGAFCLPGQDSCGSFNAANWAGLSPIRIFDVTFGDGSHPQHWAAVSDTGGKAEVLGTSWLGETPCHGSYGGPFCIYPWFSWDGQAFNYGVNYPNTVDSLGGVNQFAQQPHCPPDGVFPGDTYCDTIIK